MPIGLWNQQWDSSNGQRAYPLFEGQTRLDTTGTFEVPDELLVGLRFPVHPGLAVEPEGFYLQSLAVSGTGVEIALGYDDGSPSPPTVAVASVTFALHAENRAYDLAGRGDFDDAKGAVAVGRVAQTQQLPPGFYTFTPATARLDVDCIVPSVRNVQSLVLVNGTEESARITGDVVLAAGTNIRLSVALATGQDPVVRIDAVTGEGLTTSCDCATVLPCIKTINGVGPDANDNVTLLGNECLTVTGSGSTIQLADVCSQPCCGCPELEVVTRALQLQQNGLDGLTNFVNSLGGEIRAFGTYVLGARLRDSGCLPG